MLYMNQILSLYQRSWLFITKQLPVSVMYKVPNILQLNKNEMKKVKHLFIVDQSGGKRVIKNQSMFVHKQCTINIVYIMYI